MSFTDSDRSQEETGNGTAQALSEEQIEFAKLLGQLLARQWREEGKRSRNEASSTTEPLATVGSATH